MTRMGDGPTTARIMLVGEAFGEREEATGQPFQGPSGQLLNAMLHDAGIMRSEVYCTNLVNARPPFNDLTKWMPAKKKDITSAHVPLRDKMVLPIIRDGFATLSKEIDLIKPNVIVATGNAAMWALTGLWGVLKWRGSQLTSDIGHKPKVIPTIHPAAVLRDYAFRPIVTMDLRRAAKERATAVYTNQPKWNFIIRPSFQVVLNTLGMLYAKCEAGPLWVEFDLETSPRHITCAGISWSLTEAICIPITGVNHGDHYWTEVEEGYIIYQLYRLLTHKNCWVRGQNLLYDAQHTYRWWHFVPNVKQDTMISHHSVFAGLKKSLDFQASMYCDHYVYWKEMHKDQSNKAGA